MAFDALRLVAFEKREECDAVFEQNTRKHSTPGIQKVIADFFTLNLSDYSLPDAIFIGVVEDSAINFFRNKS